MNNNNPTYRTEVKRPWWYRSLRAVNLFCYRYWWLVLLMFISYLILWYWFCFRASVMSDRCNNIELLRSNMEKLKSTLDNCCDCSVSDLEIPPNDEISDLDRLRDSLGGKKGVITITLAWNTVDDLDLSLVEPDGEVIMYSHKNSSDGGFLDLDKNAGLESLLNPIENIYYATEPPHGKYLVKVNLFNRRTSTSSIPYQLYININGESKLLSREISRSKSNELVYSFIYP